MVYPEPSAPDGIDSSVSVECFPLSGDAFQICSEVIELWLQGDRARHPGSIVTPLLVFDLPVFLRWRGEPAWDSVELDELVEVADRLIVDSTEWKDAPAGYARLAELFERTAVSDIAWERTSRWRASLATLWPEIADVEKISVHATPAQAHLVRGWLASRLGHPVELEIEPGDRLVRVDVDGKRSPFPAGDPPDASDVLSDQLDQFGRDAVYEAAVRAAAQGQTP
jgi:glucose-6-phosphate dehydrogenase assembly protein OpcA